MAELRVPYVKDFVCTNSIRPYLERVFEGEYEVPLWGNKKVIADCGANFGAFAVWAAHRWPNSRIYCYEPHAETFKHLKENTKELPVEMIFSHQAALGRDQAFLPLYNGLNNSGEATLYPGNLCSDGTGEHVEVWSSLMIPTTTDILKIDTEGAELDILEPLIRSGRKFEAIMVEYHRRDDRRLIDALLVDYVLTGAHIYHPNIGVVKYMHKGLLDL